VSCTIISGPSYGHNQPLSGGDPWEVTSFEGPTRAVWRNYSPREIRI
jgi:hypothetical protein